MSISLKFYLDPNLTTPLSPPLLFEQAADGSNGPQTKVIYMGSTTPGRKFETVNNAGVDPILLSVIDSDPGNGQQIQSIKLALNPNELDVAIPGKALALSSTLLSGVINAVPIYIQAKDITGVVGTDNTLSLVTNNITETAYHE